MNTLEQDLLWLAAGGASYGARYVTQRRRVSRYASAQTESSTYELLRLQAAYGYNAHSLVSITEGARSWFSNDISGAVIYSEFGRVWLAAGDPLASLKDMGRLARRFAVDARKRKRIPVFVPATGRLAKEITPLGFSALRVGAAPYFDLRAWAPRGDRAKKMRAGVNQARRAGIRVDLVQSIGQELLSETAILCRRWLETRRAGTPLGWLLALDPFRHAERKRFFAARDGEGKLVGFIAASPIPARDGWYLEDVLRHPKAPQGTADLLVVEALGALAKSGATLATLGTSPLAEDGPNDVPTGDYPIIERGLRIAEARLGSLYNFEGVRRFKAKFAPSWWEGEYVLVPRGVMIQPHVAHAIFRAVAPGGLTQLLMRKVARKIRKELK